MPPSPVYNRIRTLREAKGWTQRDLAARLGCTGMTVCRYEQDDDRLYPSLIRQLAVIFDTTPAEVAGFAAPSAPPQASTVDTDLLAQALRSAHDWLARPPAPLDVDRWAALAATLYGSAGK